MYSKINEYKEVLKSDEQQYDAYIILQDGTKVDSDISGLKPIFNLGKRIVGNFATKRVEFSLFNTSKYNITNQEFEVFVGLKINDEFNYISLGKYIANKPEIKDETQDECFIIGQNYSLKFKEPYKPILTFPCTIKEAIKKICEYLNIVYVENEFINANYVLQEFFIEEDATFFDVIKILVEAGFANANIDNTNSLIVKSPQKIVDYTFSLNELFEMKKEDNKFGPLNSIVASRIVFEDGNTTEDIYAKNEPSVLENGLYEYKIKQNEAIDYDRQTAVNNILAGILNFEYIPARIEAVYNPAIELSDMLEVPDKKTDTSFLLFVKEITADLSNGLMTIESTENTRTETDYKSATNKDKNRKTELKVNKLEGEIKQVISQVDGQNQKISETLQKVDEITSKISDIADITVSKESTNGILEFEDINQSEPISIKIHPIGTNISYLYPHDNLYPADDLFMTTRTLRFTNATTSEIWNYELPDDLLIYDNENYDEFVFSYDSLSVMINKKCCYNADGTVALLDTPKTINYDFPKIELTDGDYKVELLGYSNVYMFVRLMAQNIYTTQFATKAELNSEITQTTEEVNIGVNKKLENYSTTDEMNSAINVKANEITSSVSETYTTKTDTETQINNAKSEIKQTTDNISTEVSKKVGNDEIISKINQSAEAVGIDANKIELSAEDVLNLLAGNEINLGSKSITIKSDNFSVDKNGNVVMYNAQFTGGKIHVEDTGNIDEESSIIAESDNYIAEMQSSGFTIENKNTSNADFVWITSNSLVALDENRYGFDFGIGSDGKLIWGIKDANGKLLSAGDTQFVLYSPGQATNLMLSANGAYINGYPIQTNTSDARLKNNIQDSIENALEKIMQIQHRSFEWKESGEQQKNGYIAQELEKIDSEFVINENDKYSINVLNLLSTVTKAIQEQQKQLENLQKEIENLKGAK